MAEKKIGSRLYRVDKVLASDAIRLQANLLQFVGKAVDHLPAILAGAGTGKTKEQQSASNAALVASIGSIAASADPDLMVRFFEQCLRHVMIQRPSKAWEVADLDGDFTDAPGDLYPVLGFMLKEVLGDFFAGLGASGVLQKLKTD